jgi:hypothetical protein
VQGVYVEKRSRAPKLKIRSAMVISVEIQPFWGVGSLRRFFQNMPIFGGVYIEWVWPGLVSVQLHTLLRCTCGAFIFLLSANIMIKESERSP